MNIADIPAFSIFSAVSEIFVTIAVLYAIVTNLRGRPFRWKLLGVVLLFELCVNVVYMIRQAARTETNVDISPALKALFAAHGISSLVMFVGLLYLYLLSSLQHKAGRPTWFQKHPAWSWGFVMLWLVAVGTGEFAFVWRYFLTS